MEMCQKCVRYMCFASTSQITCLHIFRYEALLEKARKEDLTDIAAFRCLYRSGVDRQGRPVIVFVGKNFSAINTDPERVCNKIRSLKKINFSLSC